MAHCKNFSFRKASTEWGRCVKVSCDSMYLSYATTWLCPSFLGVSHGMWIILYELIAGFCIFLSLRSFALPQLQSQSGLSLIWKPNYFLIYYSLIYFYLLKYFFIFNLRWGGLVCFVLIGWFFTAMTQVSFSLENFPQHL